MPEIVLRPYEDRDEDAYCTVRSLTYNDGQPIPEDRRKVRFGGRYVAEVDGEIEGVFVALPMTATRGEALFRCAGVASVAVLPHKRKSGLGRAMMAWSIRRFREEGYQLASLYAFREPFYAKTGYAVAGKRLRISAPVHRLPKVESDLAVRKLSPADWRELHPCYERFAHQRSGTHVRSEAMWERVLNEWKPLTIYAAGDPVQGYIAISHQVAFFVEQWVSEVAWCSAEGYRAILAMMHQIGINKSAVAWYEPSDSPFYSQFLDQGVDVQVDRPAMFRLCDVPKALFGLRPKGKGRIVIEAIDPVVAENQGPWEVTWGCGSTEVAPSRSEPDLKAEIGPLTQAFLGDPDVRQLVAQERIWVRSEDALETAGLLLPAMPVFCGDFF